MVFVLPFLWPLKCLPAFSFSCGTVFVDFRLKALGEHALWSLVVAFKYPNWQNLAPTHSHGVWYLL